MLWFARSNFCSAALLILPSTVPLCNHYTHYFLYHCTFNPTTSPKTRKNPKTPKFHFLKKMQRRAETTKGPQKWGILFLWKLVRYGTFLYRFKSDDEDGLVLSNPVGSGLGLEVNLGVPVPVVHYHCVCWLEIQACTARSQTVPEKVQLHSWAILGEANGWIGGIKGNQGKMRRHWGGHGGKGKWGEFWRKWGKVGGKWWKLGKIEGNGGNNGDKMRGKWWESDVKKGAGKPKKIKKKEKWEKVGESKWEKRGKPGENGPTWGGR